MKTRKMPTYEVTIKTISNLKKIPEAVRNLIQFVEDEKGRIDISYKDELPKCIIETNSDIDNILKTVQEKTGATFEKEYVYYDNFFKEE